MKKRFAILNLVSVVIVIAINYISQAIRINETTIGEVSNKYFNLFTPASYAFAIWGLIFLALLAYGIYQVKMAFFSDKASDFIEKTGYWFVITNLLNCVWVFVFAYDYTWLSVIVMLAILLCLLKIIRNNNMNIVSVSRSTIVFGWLPIGIYSGWIAVATIANVAAYLSKLNWDGSFFSEQQWTVIMMAIATLVNIIMVWKRNMREFAFVGIWALFAIYIRHNGNIDALANMALTCSIILTLVIIAHIVQNKKTNPFLNSKASS
ncbi:tryptophan-rich sensory protein [Maribacter algarum]|uniref:Tryptophan-rich sensory protein n=1 Tax=Maribacter algarum (ex Zhang et al. 2020) TaxID=2578118 RepID=A0A5S3PW97_9FLAO|nr:tryptophan-rich sensory protein [Maribacter algarum]TMM58482.1 tryptophan-rich sensory protein [Maribacter algarum]